MLIVDNRTISDRMASALLQSETLSKVEIEAIVAGKTHVDAGTATILKGDSFLSNVVRPLLVFLIGTFD